MRHDATTVLIVEDEGLIADMVRASLQDTAFAVLGTAATPERALSLAAEHRPALALVDVRLAEGGDGIALAARLQTDFAVRCIMMTGFGDTVTRARIAALGADLLAKPFRFRRLHGVLEAAAAKEARP